MNYSHWKLHSSAKNEKNASVILNRATKSIGKKPIKVEYTFDKEHGNLILFTLEHNEKEWSKFIYEVLQCAQAIGFGWHLTGYIDQEPDATTDHTNLPGVSFAQWYIFKHGQLSPSA